MITRYIFKFYRAYNDKYEFVDSIVGTYEQAAKHCDWLNSNNDIGHIYFERKERYDMI